MSQAHEIRTQRFDVRQIGLHLRGRHRMALVAIHVVTKNSLDEKFLSVEIEISSARDELAESGESCEMICGAAFCFRSIDRS